MQKPDFIVIGAQKCATTWLYHHLGVHPQVFMPADKDIEFFSYSENLNPEFASAWLQRFEGASGFQRVGDVNGAYFWTETGSQWSTRLEGFNRQIPAAVLGYLGPDVQLMASLRNPVERAISAYLHHIHEGPVTPEQRLLEVSDLLGIVDMGFFGAHLGNWLEHFAPEQFLVIDHLPSDRDSARRILDGVSGFLGLEGFEAEGEVEKAIFPGIERIIRDDGVWVAADHPRIACHLPLRRDGAERIEAGRKLLRLITGDELEELARIYSEDQALLRTLLETSGVHVVHAKATRGESA